MEAALRIELRSTNYENVVLPLNDTAVWSERLDSNQRPEASKAPILPTELLPDKRAQFSDRHVVRGVGRGRMVHAVIMEGALA